MKFDRWRFQYDLECQETNSLTLELNGHDRAAIRKGCKSKWEERYLVDIRRSIVPTPFSGRDVGRNAP